MVKHINLSMQNRSTLLEAEWQKLCALYLPLSQIGSIWRYHGGRTACRPERGWKLHISATVLNAVRVLQKVAPVLVDHGVQFKAPSSLKYVMTLNSGLDGGYSQVGKIFTVYPETPEQAVRLARKLHKLTLRMPAPEVPFDLKYRRSSNVYYRFGAFLPAGNAYLVMEFIDGETLQSVLSRLQRRMPISRVLKYGIQLAEFISRMHAAGWVWRDCKPMNIVVTRTGSLQPLDFEGACRIDRPDAMLWGTPGFIPPEWRAVEKQTGRADDLYALGAMLYLLATGRTPSSTNPVCAKKLRRNIPAELCKLIQSLLGPDPRRRPDAKKTLTRLNQIRDEPAKQASQMRGR